MAAPLAPFAAAEARLNASVLRRLSNATATWQGGQPFGVILEMEQGSEYVPGAPITAERRTVSLAVSSCPGIAEEAVGLVVNGVAYRVASAVVPDATGWAVISVMEE